MASDLELSVTAMFRDATMQTTIPELRTDADWKRFNEIKEEAEQHTNEELEAFERDRPTLLAEARKELIEKAGALTLDHPTPMGIDRFSTSNIEDQAVSQVDLAHQGRLTAILKNEADAHDGLKKDIEMREDTRGMARDGFARATDRRDGEDRRAPTQSR